MPSDQSRNPQAPAGEAPEWPARLALNSDAMHGPAGAIVRALEPHSEADPVALLVHLLVMFGSAIGHLAHYVVGGTKHTLNLFALIVGKTGKGRKGTAYDDTFALLQIAEPQWAARCVQSGLTSGEGLIHAVRDPSPARVVNGHRVPPDAGVSDKRLLVPESEFSAVLRNSGRPGNILSPTVRQAWDRGDLRVMAKSCPDVATGAHISMIGHISKEELEAELSTTDRANGFGNRFVYVCAARSKYLPDGGSLDPAAREALAEPLKAAVAFGQTVQEMKRDEDARALWHEVYPQLSDGQVGLAGAMLSRAEAQVLRLSCIYALLDCSAVVRLEHLRAALALWTYLEASVRYIFGKALGHSAADQILPALRQASNGMSRTEIRDLLGHHARTGEVVSALNLLQELGLARCQKVPTNGRPIEKWFAIAEASATEATEGTEVIESD